MAPTIGDYIIFFNRLFFLSCTVVSETGVESMAMGGEPFHHRFILLKVRYRLDSRRQMSNVGCAALPTLGQNG